MIPSDHAWHPSQTVWSPETLAHFTFVDQSLGHIIFFAIAALVQILSLVACVLALFHGRTLWHFAWAVGSMIGLGKAMILWNGADGDFYPISIQLPVMDLAYDPASGLWTVSFAIPVIALIYLGRRLIRVRPR